MRLSDLSRSVIDSPITQAKEWAALWKGGERLLDVSQAAPDYPPAEELQQHVAELAQQPCSATYTDQLGLPELREALAADVNSQYRADVSSAEVAITAGCNQAFCLAVMAIAEPGDEVVLPVPYYFNHDMWLRLLGVRPLYALCGESLLPDPERISSLITQRTRALVLVTPNNPSGAVYPPALIERLDRLARERGLALIVDETYRDFRGEDSGSPHELFANPEWSETLIQLYSFSKAYAIPGYRIGAITGSRPLLREVAKIVDCISICPTHLSQRAALYCLGNLRCWKVDKSREIAQRMAGVSQRMAAGGQLRVVSAGAYFAYARHPFTDRDARAAARILAEELGILALSGDMFGPEQDDYLRLAFANLDLDGIHELAERLGNLEEIAAAAQVQSRLQS